MKIIITLLIVVFSSITLGAMELGKYGTFKFEKMGNSNVWIMHGPAVEPNVENRGFMNNPAIIEAKDGLIVIDPGGNYNIGKEVLKEIEKVSKKPIIAILNTHKHGDHWFANKALAEKYPSVKIYAHMQMIKEVKASEAKKWYGILDRLSHNLKGTKPFKFPAYTLKDGDELNINGQIFKIYHPKRAHTDTDILILHKNSDTLFLGDNVMKNRLGGFDESSSVLGNIELLQNLMKQTNHKLYVPGHGPSGAKEEVITPYLKYLTTLRKWAKKAYEDDEDYYAYKDEATKELGDISKWDAYSHQMGKHLNKVYREIEEADMQ